MEFNLKLNEEQINIIISGLGELPAKISFDLINKIKDEVIIQSKKDK